jgi:hypothetical protein
VTSPGHRLDGVDLPIEIPRRRRDLAGVIDSGGGTEERDRSQEEEGLALPLGSHARESTRQGPSNRHRIGAARIICRRVSQ